MLQNDFSNFFESFEVLKLIFSNARHACDKFGLGYDLKSKKYVKTTYNSWKSRHSSIICKHKQHLLETNKKGCKKISVPKVFIIHVTYVLYHKRPGTELVSEYWMLATHDERKVYIPT